MELEGGNRCRSKVLTPLIFVLVYYILFLFDLSLDLLLIFSSSYARYRIFPDVYGLYHHDPFKASSHVRILKLWPSTLVLG
jgi:hypothetical protein